jgi:hypothetical protein
MAAMFQQHITSGTAFSACSEAPCHRQRPTKRATPNARSTPHHLPCSAAHGSSSIVMKECCTNLSRQHVRAVGYESRCTSPASDVGQLCPSLGHLTQYLAHRLQRQMYTCILMRDSFLRHLHVTKCTRILWLATTVRSVSY